MALFDLFCIVMGRALVGFTALMLAALAAFLGIMAAEAIRIKRKRVKK